MQYFNGRVMVQVLLKTRILCTVVDYIYSAEVVSVNDIAPVELSFAGLSSSYDWLLGHIK